eukprot:1195699-Prorocentrum_minimum.AAC.1
MTGDGDTAAEIRGYGDTDGGWRGYGGGDTDGGWRGYGDTDGGWRGYRATDGGWRGYGDTDGGWRAGIRRARRGYGAPSCCYLAVPVRVEVPADDHRQPALPAHHLVRVPYPEGSYVRVGVLQHLWN